MSTVRHTRIHNDPRLAGWTNPGNVPHLCFPPRSYPMGAGPGAIWRCLETWPEGCGTVWLAVGIMPMHDEEDWPQGGKGRTPLYGPERWVPHMNYLNQAIDAKGGEEQLNWETGQYDFVSAIDKIVPLLNLIVDMLQGRST